MLNKIIDKLVKEQIVTLYQSGINVKTLMTDFSIGKNLIYVILHEYKVTRPARYQKKFPIEVELEIATKYQNRIGSHTIAKEYNITPTSVVSIAKRHNKMICAAGGRVKQLPQDEIDKIVERWKNGESQKSIGKDYNISQVVLSKFLVKNGIDKTEKSKARGSRNARWKGGVIIDKRGGYIYVKLDEKHKYYCMTNHCNYVAQHRLIMAEHLNRPLDRKEQIHHINGNRKDNQIENLELRQGNHGNGICYQCQDCLSTNIKAVKLGQQITKQYQPFNLFVKQTRNST